MSRSLRCSSGMHITQCPAPLARDFLVSYSLILPSGQNCAWQDAFPGTSKLTLKSRKYDLTQSPVINQSFTFICRQTLWGALESHIGCVRGWRLKIKVILYLPIGQGDNYKRLQWRRWRGVRLRSGCRACLGRGIRCRSRRLCLRTIRTRGRRVLLRS